MPNARPYSSIIERLKVAGLRPTRQRLALAKLLFDNGNRHLTAEHLHGEAIAANVRVSLATIYNTLHQFTGAGLLREVVVEAGRSYFDTNVEEHHHFYFEDTCALEDIPGDHLRVADLPAPPEGTRVARVDVVVRVKSSSS
jgi:Fur family iron response transcriptional regulator